jgi:hypothetical protein
VIRAARIVATAATLLLAGGGSAQALTLEPVGNFDQPIFVTSDPGDAGRLFVAEREGTIQLIENGVEKEFADLSGEVECGGACQGERGLMSIALSPDFDSDGRLFVFYANDEDGALHIDELSAEPDRESADPSSLEPLLEIAHSAFANHNGGQLQFGPDGALYASTGDGGGSNDPLHNGQDPTSLLGKILRIDLDSPTLPSIWSRGLRNPFRFSFDRLSGDMVIGDVGQGLREEIDLAPSPFPGVTGGQGANYGWNCREGFFPGPATDPQCATAPPQGFVDPVFDYPHSPDPDSGGSRCSITGGYVVRDPSLGALFGHYVYADYCAGVLRALQLPAGAGDQAGGDCSLGLEVDDPVSFGEDAGGQLYVVEQGGGVFRLEGPPPANCPLPKPVVGPRLSPTFIGIKAQRRRVERGRTAVLTVWVSPCGGRKGDIVALRRNGRRNGSKFLSRACTARFLRRVSRNTAFAATTFAEDTYLAGDSRRLRIKIKPRRRR